jgi:putative SOS response-associated peptidase YedK
MCGRIKQVIDGDWFILVDRAGVVYERKHRDDLDRSAGIDYRYNIAPTENLLVVHDFNGGRHLSEMRWWLTPHWSDGPSQKFAMFNARAESIEQSRAYKGPFQYRRAIIPVNGFYEWRQEDGKKYPYFIESESGPLALAGVWDSWSDGTQELLSCSIITTEASDAFRSIHSRMPVILEWDRLEEWLDEKTGMGNVRSMLAPSRANLVATRMNPKMSNARNKEAPEPLAKTFKLVE